jgi:hypothetical protein
VRRARTFEWEVRRIRHDRRSRISGSNLGRRRARAMGAGEDAGAIHAALTSGVSPSKVRNRLRVVMRDSGHQFQ